MSDAEAPLELHSAELDGRWLRPASSQPAEPRWGHPDGLQVGLHPLGGPRGLLRLYAPYLNHARDRLINFIAVEPIPAGTTQRGYSELERSALDGVQGKRFSSSNTRDGAPHRAPARGVTDTVDGVEHLRLFVQVEPFDNGAHVVLRVSFRADRPHEVGIATFQADGCVNLDYCVISATMGNFARLRRLALRERIVTPAQLWPAFSGSHFAERATFPVTELDRNQNGDAIVSATPDEAEPRRAEYAADTGEHWKYVGRPARQIWRAPAPAADLEVGVNGRHAYWASSSPIPGGTSFENFELIEPFRDGREFFFGVEPL